MDDYGWEESDRALLPAVVVLLILGGALVSFVACNIIASAIF